MNKLEHIKIAVAIPYFYPHVGGMEKHVNTILSELVQHYNCKIVVVTSSHETNEYEETIQNGVKIYRLPWSFKISNTPISFNWRKQIKKIFEVEKPDVINGQGPVPFMADIACMVAKELDIPFVLSWHFPSMKKGSVIYDPIINLYENIFFQRMLRNSIQIICSSPFVKNNFLKKFEDKVTVITQGIDFSIFRKINVKKEKSSILFVGNLETEVKGLKYLLDAIKIVAVKYPQVKLNVVGHGNIRLYENYCNKLNIAKFVSFKGILQGKALINEFNRNKIFVSPSTSENLPSTIFEAIACGLPVISTKVGSIPDFIVNYKNGILVDKRNSFQIADNISILFEDKKLYKYISSKGVTSINSFFNWEEKVESTYRIFLKSINHEAK